jgi:hypothetical protein
LAKEKAKAWVTCSLDGSGKDLAAIYPMTEWLFISSRLAEVDKRYACACKDERWDGDFASNL